MATAFYWDERCFWHGGGNYALTVPVGGLVQPGGGLPENPETKRRLKNLLEVSGLIREITVASAPEASWDEMARVHPESYLRAFKAASDAGGGELGLRTPSAAAGSRSRRCRRALRCRRCATCWRGGRPVPMPCRARRGTIACPNSRTASAFWPTSPLPSAPPGPKAAPPASPWSTGTCTTATAPRRSSWPTRRC